VKNLRYDDKKLEIEKSLLRAGQHPTGRFTTNLYRFGIHNADLNTNCLFQRLNKANELSPGFYLFFRQERYSFPKI